MNLIRLLAAPLVFLAAAAVWLPLFVIGLPVTFVMALLGRWHRGVRSFVWKDPWMKIWQTSDNGCCAFWYDKRFDSRPRWLNVFMWSGMRNAVGWEALSVRYQPTKVKWEGSSNNPLRAALKTDRFHWLLTSYGWFPGLWLVWPLKKRTKTDHFEVRLGWKLLPGDDLLTHRARFTPWDIGRRLN